MKPVLLNIKIEPAVSDPDDNIRLQVGRQSITFPRTLLPTLNAHITTFMEQL